MSRITVKSAKAKGRNFQKQVAERISKLLDIPVEKDGEIESRPMGQSGTDIILRGDALELFPYSCEMKNQQNVSIHQWIEQAKTNTKEGTNWLLFFKRNHEKPVVIMDMDAFFKIIEENLNWRRPE